MGIISNDLKNSGPKKDIPKTLILIRSSTKKEGPTKKTQELKELL